MQFSPEIKQRLNEWLEGPYDQKTQATIEEWIQNRPEEINNAFYTELSFGTAGLRAVMGIGSARLNEYTIQKTTQGLANYLLEKSTEKPPRVVIGFDNRNNSQFFAEKAASVLAANGVQVLLFKELRPTPFVSFICREKACSAGIMITASHNPGKYNGYKVYSSYGGQITSPEDEEIIAHVHKVKKLSMVKVADLSDPLITQVGNEWDNLYIKAIEHLQNHNEQNQNLGKTLKIVYTSLHGTGITLTPKALESWGFSNVHLVPIQTIPDGNFPTAVFPNPEIKETMSLGIEEMQKINGDLLIANDPDADRIGIGAMHNGQVHLFNGNEIAAICAEYLAMSLQEKNKLSSKDAFITTIVTTELIHRIANEYKIAYFEVLTGFKYIGELIEKWETAKDGYKFLFGGEESYGYLAGTHARDKDAVVMSCIISEIALHAKTQNLTLVDLLEKIYCKYGIFREKQKSISCQEGAEGMHEISSMMHYLRTNPPQSVSGKKIVKAEDFLSLKKESSSLHLPPADVLVYRLEDKSKIVIRPSGTEPKMKIYGSVQMPISKTIEEDTLSCDRHLDLLLQNFEELCRKALKP